MMRDKVLGLFLFSLGAVVGSLVTYRALYAQFNKKLDEELEAAKEYYSSNKSEVKEESKEEPEKETKEETAPEVVNDENDIVKNRYRNLARQYSVEEENNMDEPYVISPDEFGVLAEYDTESLTYYEVDKVLTYETDEVIYDVDRLVGEDSLNRFGEFEADSVFVRNDHLRTDYEILRDKRSYDEVVGGNPRSAEDK